MKVRHFFFVIATLVAFWACEKPSDLEIVQPKSTEETVTDTTKTEIPDYRIPFTGQYFAIKICTMITLGGIDTTEQGFTSVKVSIDTASTDKIYLNSYLIPIDTSGTYIGVNEVADFQMFGVQFTGDTLLWNTSKVAGLGLENCTIVGQK